MLNRIKLFIDTIRFLRSKQLFYQIWYRVNKVHNLNRYDSKIIFEGIANLKFSLEPTVLPCAKNDNTFEFLNLQKKFDDNIDWNFQKFGKLWNYNLQYCSFLGQKDIRLEKKEEWIFSLYSWLSDGRLPLEPYPTSLRIINVIRFICDSNKKNQRFYKLLNLVHSELDFLNGRFEFHLLGNHLLENSFSLLMGGAFFSENKWIQKGKKIITQQLEEQIHKDGGHFELSPMYHQIILFRLLELIDWYSNYANKDEKFELFIRKKASDMISWLNKISFRNGEIPYLNDSAADIAYSTTWLNTYAKELNVYDSEIALKDSGYYSYNIGNYECRIDAAQIGASYQAGHGHADSLSFLLNMFDQPFIVDSGTSTYEPNSIVRRNERSTISHNTVVVNGIDQSQVYGGFRVARRAKTNVIFITDNQLVIEHNGYNERFGVIHRREFLFDEYEIVINDFISKPANSISYLHFHPSVELDLKENTLFIDKFCTINFEGASSIGINSYQFAQGFNKTKVAKVLWIKFDSRLRTNIIISN